MKNVILNPMPVMMATHEDDLSELLHASIELENLRKENKELKMLNAMCKLTDFTADQLIFCIVAINEMKDAAKHSLAKHQSIGTDPQHEQVKFWEGQLDNALTWEIQLVTAKNIVLERELVTAN
jgi:hypothetical protein